MLSVLCCHRKELILGPRGAIDRNACDKQDSATKAFLSVRRLAMQFPP